MRLKYQKNVLNLCFETYFLDKNGHKAKKYHITLNVKEKHFGTSGQQRFI